MCKRERVPGKGNIGFYRVHNKTGITYQYIKSVKRVELTGTCQTLALAKAEFRLKEAQVLEGSYCEKRGTLQQVYDRFFTIKKESVGKSRQHDIGWMFDNYIAPSFSGERQIKSITREDVDLYIVALHKLKMAEPSKLNIWSLVKQIFIYALQNNYVSIDVTAGKKYIIPKDLLPKEPLPFTEQDQHALLNYTYSHREERPNDYLAMLLTIKAGLRIGEVLGLRWCDIDFDQQTIHVAEQFNNSLKARSSTKNHTDRLVPINSDLLEYLLEEHAKLNPEPTTYLFPGLSKRRKEKGQPQSHASMEDHFRKISRALGISKVHPHRGRRTFATESRIHGADRDDVGRLLGHKLGGVTNKYIYSKIMYQSSTIAAVNSIGKPVGEVIRMHPKPLPLVTKEKSVKS